MDDLKRPMFWVLVALTVLIAIVAVGNWRLYPRLERIEKTLEQPAMLQSQQKS